MRITTFLYQHKTELSLIHWVLWYIFVSMLFAGLEGFYIHELQGYKGWFYFADSTLFIYLMLLPFLGLLWMFLRLSNKKLRSAKNLLFTIPATLYAVIHILFYLHRDFFKESLLLNWYYPLFAVLTIIITVIVFQILLPHFVFFVFLVFSWTRWCISLLGIALLVVSIVSNAETQEVKSQKYLSKTPSFSKDTPVFLVVIDTLRYDFFSRYFLETPSFIQKQFTNYTNVTAPASWTKPSVASILTGLYPFEHQVIHKDDVVSDSMTTIGDILFQNGYHTVGLFNNANLAPVFGFQKGFQKYVYLLPKYLGSPFWANYRQASYQLIQKVLLKFFPLLKEPDLFYAPASRINAIVQDIITDEMKTNQNSFFYIHYMDPHDPYFSHDEIPISYARFEHPHPDASNAFLYQYYYEKEVQYIKTFIDSFLETLSQKDFFDSSLIIITSDHGEGFYEHEHFWHGTTLHEELIHVPLAVKYPSQKGFAQYDNPASLIDIVPTVLDTLHIQTDNHVSGIVLPKGDNSEGMNNRYIFSEEDHQGYKIWSVKYRSFKMIYQEYENKITEEMYYLARDPKEENPLVWHPLKDEMHKVLQEYIKKKPVHFSKEIQEPLPSTVAEQLRSLGYVQ